jgi:ferric-dicitrate binding protein FerR (iron transport regulator)
MIDDPTFRAGEGAADDVLRALVEEPVAPLPAAEAAALRQRVIARMEAQRDAGAVDHAPAWRRTSWLFAAACLPALVWLATNGGAPAGRRAGEATLTDVTGHADVRDDEVSTGADATARADLPVGATVDIGAATRVSFPPDRRAQGSRSTQIELATGRVDVSVPKLAPGHDLRVHTAQATVVVHGTRFAVVATGADTRVSVTEGVVEVDGAQGARLLTAGTSLVVPAADPASAAPPAPPAGAAQDATDVEPPPGTHGSAGSASTLGAENALLADAMRLRREQRGDVALARLGELVARFPASPLVETARVERLHVLRDLHEDDRLAREASAYLSDYPHGFARAEASRLLSATRPAHP